MFEPRQKRKKKKGEIGFFLWAVSIYTADQISKRAVVGNIGYLSTVPIIPDFFHLTHVLNNGASFGMLQDQATLFIWVSVFVLLFITWAVFFWQGADRYARLLLGMVSGGALGNLADRLQYGAVVDFLDFRGIWPYIFNFADVAVVCGGTLLAIYVIMEDKSPWLYQPKH